jgi:putative glutamine amidotransferase
MIRICSWIFFLLVCPLIPLLSVEEPATLILIRPQERQIENLVELKKQGLLPRDIRVVAVYHEDEFTDYSPARLYVQQNGLEWIRFQPITGGISLDSPQPARGTNAWTNQFLTLFKESDGILFTGGMDFPPWLYGDETRLTTEATTPVRSIYELSFLHHLVGDKDKGWTPWLEKRPEYAVLCICLGCQTLNVAAGGTLIQNIPSQIYGLTTFEQVLRQPAEQIHSGRYLAGLNPHRADTLPPAFHSIRPNGHGRITPALLTQGSPTPQILSSHHQALGILGHGLVVTATSMDGRIVEMVEHEQFPGILGVQFHPEAFSLYRAGVRYDSNWAFTGRHEGNPVKTEKRGWLNYGIPSEKSEQNLGEHLEKTHSIAFHRAIWSWFSSALKGSRSKR